MARKIVTRLSAEIDDRLYITGSCRQELADSIGISRSMLSQILTGRQKPTIKVGRAIAEYIGMDDKQLRKIVLETIKDQQRAG